MNPVVSLEWHLPFVTPDDPVLTGHLVITSEVPVTCEVHRIWISQAIPRTQHTTHTRIIASIRLDMMLTLLPAQPTSVPFALHIRRPVTQDPISNKMKRYAGPWSIACEIGIAGELLCYSQALTGHL
ncbi:MAG: hypothetical protein SF053_06850 [Bacteroidia bacterium]|nr:hypothetical protein [Bacteroidia bacterium]